MKIVALAYNYKGYDRPPIIFMKRGMIGDGDAIEIPGGIVWAEVELGFIINEDGGIGDYMLANDVTLERPGLDVHFAQSKCLDTFCPIRSLGKINNPDAIYLNTIVNQKVVHSGNTKDRILNDREALCFVAQFMTLNPGDIVLTGTPPHDKPLIRPGDIVTVEAMGKILTNPVKRKTWKPFSL